MDEMTAIGLSVIGTLAGLSYLTRSWSRVSYLCTWLDVYVRGISGRNSFKEGRK